MEQKQQPEHYYETPAQLFFGEFYKKFKNTLFTEHLQVTACKEM